MWRIHGMPKATTCNLLVRMNWAICPNLLLLFVELARQAVAFFWRFLCRNTRSQNVGFWRLRNLTISSSSSLTDCRNSRIAGPLEWAPDHQPVMSPRKMSYVHQVLKWSQLNDFNDSNPICNCTQRLDWQHLRSQCCKNLQRQRCENLQCQRCENLQHQRCKVYNPTNSLVRFVN
jgi:hypothetical protein